MRDFRYTDKYVGVGTGGENGKESEGREGVSVSEARRAQNEFKSACDEAEERSLEHVVQPAWKMYHAIDVLEAEVAGLRAQLIVELRSKHALASAYGATASMAYCENQLARLEAARAAGEETK